jgi:hypothetical protein
MTWSSPYLQYSDAVAFLRKVEQENSQVFNELQSYLELVRQKFDELMEDSKASPVRNLVSVPRMDLVPRPSAVQEAPISQFLLAPDFAFSPYAAASQQFPRLVAQLTTLRDEFHAKLDTICKNMTTDLDVLSGTRTRLDKAYSLYQKAADELRAAADRKGPDIAELKAAFVAAQQKAVDRHTEMNEMTAQTAMKMEGALTAYEEAEQWKSEQIRGFLLAVADWCEEFSKKFEGSNANFQRLTRKIPTDEDLMTTFDGSKLPDPRSCDDFVVVRMDHGIMQILDPPSLFPNAAKDGLPLFRVTKTCHAEGRKLGVATGEIVCQIEERGDSIWAATINDVTGFVPKSAIAKV